MVMFRNPKNWFKLGDKTRQRREALNEDCYANFINNWLEVFPRKNFLFLMSEDYFADSQATIDQITDFVGVKRYAAKIETHLQYSPHDDQLEKLKEQLDREREPVWQECGRKLQQLVKFNIPWVKET